MCKIWRKSTLLSEMSGFDTQPGPAPEKSRCAVCARKLGLLGFECRCGQELCANHRLSFQHACGYDHAAADKSKLATDLTRVTRDKVARV